MPNTTSARRTLRRSARKAVMNQRRKRKYKVLIKDFRTSVQQQSFDKAQSLLPNVYKALDKAAKGNTIKRNKANRLKSRLTKSLRIQGAQA